MTPKLNKDRAFFRDFKSPQFLLHVALKAGWKPKKKYSAGLRETAAAKYLESKGFVVTVDDRFTGSGIAKPKYKITRSLGAGKYQSINEVSDLSDPNIFPRKLQSDGNVRQAGSSKHPGLLGVDKPVRKKRSKRGLYL